MVQPTLVGFSLVNAPRQPKRLPQKTTVWQHTVANLRRPPLQPGTLVPRPTNDGDPPRPTTTLRPSTPTTGRLYRRTPGPLPIRRVFTEPLGSVSSSSRGSAPGDFHPTPLHRDGCHPAVSAETTAHYLPSSDQTRSQRTTCARAPTFSPEPPQSFPTDSRMADTTSIAIWLGWFLRQRHRSIRDTAPNFRAFRIHPLRAFCALPETLAEPSYCLYLREIVSSLCEHRPSTACLAMTPARGQQPLPSPPT